MRRVQCVHCERVYMVHLIDPDNGKKDGHLRMCQCSIAGECEIGYDCGKGKCPCYKQPEKENAK